jgi:signal transduction histidine kinase
MRISEEQQNKNAALKRGKESAELSNRIKNEFVTAMSHELRTPLNTIIGFSEIIKNEMYGPLANPQYAQYIQDIYQSSKHLEALVNDIMSLSVAEASLTDMQDKAVDIRLVMGRAIRGLTERLQQRRIAVDTDIPADLPRLMVDEQRLRQIFLNLLNNAISHTPEGGNIHVAAAVEKDMRLNDWLNVSFTDHGAKSVGQEKEAAGMGHNVAGIRRIDLSGLRIPLTKALVAMHQATLDIVSPPGKPTVVTVRFPKSRIVY